jgi:predicted signal transduction protein with EAL and GGDEF domain
VVSRNRGKPSEVVTTSAGIRFVTFVTVGIVTGYVAQRNRTVIAELEVLAERDALTGLPNTRAFER